MRLCQLLIKMLSPGTVSCCCFELGLGPQGEPYLALSMMQATHSSTECHRFATNTLDGVFLWGCLESPASVSCPVRPFKWCWRIDFCVREGPGKSHTCWCGSSCCEHKLGFILCDQNRPPLPGVLVNLVNLCSLNISTDICSNHKTHLCEVYVLVYFDKFRVRQRFLWDIFLTLERLPTPQSLISFPLSLWNHMDLPILDVSYE